MASHPQSNEDTREIEQERSALARYSGIAVQMVAIIGLSTWLGVWLDGYFHTRTPWYTIGLCLAGVTLAMVQVIRSASQP